MGAPAYRRLDVDERRQQLLERGAELFTSHPYEELSMSRIAREVGISKALLYHYFPSKQAYFEATLSAWAEQLRERTEPDPDLSPVEQLMTSLDAFLALVEENAVAYRNLMRERGRRRRDPRADRRGAAEDGAAHPRRAVPGRGAAEGAHRRQRLALVHGRRLPRTGSSTGTSSASELRDLLLGVLMGALVAADAAPDLDSRELKPAAVTADTALSCAGDGRPRDRSACWPCSPHSGRLPRAASAKVPQATLTPGGRAIAPASAPPAVKAMIEAANRIRHRPYRWGGGHRSWNSRGYDCSGSVSYVMHAAGLLDYPLDSRGFMRWGGGGAGSWVRIYANTATSSR